MTVWKSTMWTGTEIITDEIIWPYSIGIATTRLMRCVYDKHQTVEEPCEGLNCAPWRALRELPTKLAGVQGN